MRIGINASFLRKPGTGIGNMTECFLRELGKGEFSQKNEYILYLEEDTDVSYLPGNFSKSVLLPWWKRDDVPRKWLWEKFTLPKKIQADRCDAFLSLYQSATILPGSISHTMLVHDIIPELFPEYRGNLRQELLWRSVCAGIQKASRIVAVSESTKRDLQRLSIPEERISVAYQALTNVFSEIPKEEWVEEVLKKYGLTKGYIYHGGGLEVRKNAQSLLLAYKELCAERSVPKLVISGKIFAKGNPLALDIEGVVHELGIEKEVVLLGFVPENDLPSLYRGAGVFVYPSLYEGFGLPVLEALRMGVPTLCSSASSLPEVGGDAVLYCNPESVSDIQEKLKLLLEDGSLREKLSLAGPKQAEKFHFDTFVSALLSSFE